MSKYVLERYTCETWPIGRLIKYSSEGKLNLQPHYQRNDVWSSRAQRELIDTIGSGMPLPTFFVRPNGGIYEMVDGQQRSRAIIGFRENEISDLAGVHFRDLVEQQQGYFDCYKLHVVLLNGFSDKETEAFYVLVNSSGVRLNRPELKKAAYYSSSLLKLCEDLASSPEFEKLKLFSDKSAERMNDIDFISELITLLIHGITDKKEKVDQLFDSDIDRGQYEAARSEAVRIFKLIGVMSDPIPFSATRLKQKGDFYTLFDFLHTHRAVHNDLLAYLYAFIIKAMPHIRPSQEQCETFKEYALACVSQANSKDARVKRRKIFDDLFYNTTATPTDAQMDVMKYFSGLERRDVRTHRVGPCMVVSV